MLNVKILSGTAFKTALISIVVFLVILSAVGFGLYNVVKNAMYQELESQISEEIILFQDIANRGGQDALVAAIADLKAPLSNANAVVGLFGKDGIKLVGNADFAPDFVGWQSKNLDNLRSNPVGNFRLNAVPIDVGTIVVGRSTGFIDKILQTMISTLIMAFIIVATARILIGYATSKQSFERLAKIEKTLDLVSNGDMDARILIDGSNDQIERTSYEINKHLDHLRLLTLTNQNTISAIAHDLRTPLNRAYMLLQESIDGVKGKSVAKIEAASEEIANLTDIFDTTLRISKIRSGKSQEKFSTISMSALVEEIAETFTPVVEDAGDILIYNTVDQADLSIFGDHRMMGQLLVNLIENATNHCPKGTSITIDLRKDVAGQIILSVSDNGEGIPEEMHAAVLEPFQRLDSSRSTPGSGLGLALVAAIADRHNAEIKLLDNQPGLRVEIKFPVTK